MPRKKTKNLPQYLLTLQLLEAGYLITWDELVEMNEAKAHLNNEHVTEGMFISEKQHDTWYKKAVKIVMDEVALTQIAARFQVSMLALDYGLPEK